MVHIQILSGKKAGTRWVTRRFPVRIGRSPASDLQLEEDGVWEDHVELTLDPVQGFHLKPRPDAPVTVNDQPAQTTRLRNGDSIDIGSVRVRFWLAETSQRGLRIREWFVWTVVAAISVGQVWLVHWLLK